MSIENYRAGLQDLTAGLEKRESRRNAELRDRQRRASLSQLTETLAGTAEGQTGVGQFAQTGLKTGLLEPDKVLGVLKGMDRTKLIFALHNKALVEKDPANRRMLQDVVNKGTEFLMKFNENDAWAKSHGRARGKFPFDMQKLSMSARLRRSGKGRGGKGGEGGYATGPDGTVPVSINASFLNGPLENFVMKHRYYRRTDNKLMPALSVPSTVQEQMNFRQDLKDEIRGQIDSQYNLPSGKAEELAVEWTQTFMRYGLRGFEKQGTTGKNIFNRNLVEDIYMDPDELSQLQQDRRVYSQPGGKGKKKKLFYRKITEIPPEAAVQDNKRLDKIPDNFYEQ